MEYMYVLRRQLQGTQHTHNELWGERDNHLHAHPDVLNI